MPQLFFLSPASRVQKCSNFLSFILAYRRGFKSDITGGLICRVIEVVLRSLLMVIDPLCKQSGVLIYKTVTDRLVTREQPREMGFMGRTAFTGSKFVYLSFF